ncbi:unnamed protein product [Urochloa decumbens]|uniref:Uncharacterized protein n=1 Tax=Urochloa decumbens TaxID=240449 RepID=A0ABC9GAF6_9POAL
MFPTKKRKVDKISSLHPALVYQPSHSSGTGGEDYSAKKTGAYLMDELMESETGTPEKLGMEHSASPTKPSASSLRHLSVPTMTIQGKDEDKEITSNLFMKPCIGAPLLATSEKRDTDKLMLVSEAPRHKVHYFVLISGISSVQRTLTFLPPTPTRSDLPSADERRVTALASIPSIKIEHREVEVEVVKETSTSQGLAHDFSMLREAVAPDQNDPRQKTSTNSASSVPPATTVVATDHLFHIETQNQYSENLRSELLNICNQNSESLLQRIEAYISQSQVYKEVARLKEELENERSEKTAAVKMVRVLEERFQGQTEGLHSESERSQQIMAAQKKLLQEHAALKSEMARKDEDLTNLKHNNIMVEKRNIDLEQRNRILEDRIDHIVRSIEEFQKADSYQ